MNTSEILILTSKKHEAMAERGIKKLQVHTKNNINCVAYEDLSIILTKDSFNIIDEKHNRDLRTYALLRLRFWINEQEELAYIVALYAEKYGITYIDKEALQNHARSKLAQYALFQLHGLPFPQTVFSLNKKNFKKRIEQARLQYPFIVKDAYRNKGVNNFLITSEAQLTKVTEELPSEGLLAQEYIPNDHDYRVFALGGRVGTLSKRSRTSKDTHLNNIAHGATEEQINEKDLPKKAIQDALKAASTLKRDVSGVDFIINKETGDHVLLEANNDPGVTYETEILTEAIDLGRYLDEIAGNKAKKAK